MNKTKWVKVFKGAVIAATGAALTALVSYAGEVDFGAWTPVVTAALSVAVNFVRKLGTKDE